MRLAHPHCGITAKLIAELVPEWQGAALAIELRQGGAA
jgi:hypothetical protein